MGDDTEAALARHLGQVIAIVQDEPARLGSSRLLTIDGPAGAGKTTVARVLATLANDAPIVHLDDLYAGWDGLTTELFQRVHRDLILPLAADGTATLAAWDWLADRFNGSIQVDPAPLIILEGVGAGDASIRPWCSQQLWVDLDVTIAAKRGLERDLAASDPSTHPALRSGWQVWVDGQDRYLASSDNRAMADLTLTMTPS